MCVGLAQAPATQPHPKYGPAQPPAIQHLPKHSTGSTHSSPWHRCSSPCSNSWGRRSRGRTARSTHSPGSTQSTGSTHSTHSAGGSVQAQPAWGCGRLAGGSALPPAARQPNGGCEGVAHVLIITSTKVFITFRGVCIGVLTNLAFQNLYIMSQGTFPEGGRDSQRAPYPDLRRALNPVVVG